MPAPVLFEELLSAIAILPENRFYAEKFKKIPARTRFADVPFTTKAELVADQESHPPYGTNLTFPIEQYARLHQTSGTTSGRPLRWLDTPESWNWMLGCWMTIFELVGLRPGDRLFFPFSFGPFLGFWTAFEAAQKRGCLALSGGGMSSSARLRLMLENEATVVFCTPTYGLHLSEAARTEGIDLHSSPVRALIVAGEPGGSILATRNRIEQTWSARVFDHYGMTEIGPTAVECVENPGGIHVLETEYIAEIVDPHSGRAVSPGDLGELVLTNLGRAGSPLLRYRTGDLVRADPKPCPCGRPYLRLEGGILGRADDMICVRGNNVFPSSLEALIRRFPDVAEYRVEVDASSTLPELRVEVEPIKAELGASLVKRVDRAIRDELLFRPVVTAAPPGSLPRYEFKANRVSRKDAKTQSNVEGGRQ